VFTASTGIPKEINPLIMELKVREFYAERVGTEFVTTYKDYNLTKCTEDKIPGITEAIDGQLYADELYCPDNYDFEAYGNFGSQKVTGLNIQLNKCLGLTCADNNTMNAYLADAR
jgi:hypothetical protein